MCKKYNYSAGLERPFFGPEANADSVQSQVDAAAHFVGRASELDRLADALREALYGPNPGFRAGELVRHLAHAIEQIGTAKLVRYALLAAEHALASYAPHEALGAFVHEDKETAAACLEYFLPKKGCYMPTGAAGKSSDGVLGLLCVTLSRLDEAAKHFEDALAFCRGAGYLPELAWTYYDYAGALFRRNPGGDRRRAEQLLVDGRSLARQLGMRPLLSRIEQNLRRVKGVLPDKPTRPARLTEREVEALNLVARGFTNSEIGEQLYISPHTVSRHIQNVFEKTGMSNRAEATAFAMREGLIDE